MWKKIIVGLGIVLSVFCSSCMTGGEAKSTNGNATGGSGGTINVEGTVKAPGSM